MKYSFDVKFSVGDKVLVNEEIEGLVQGITYSLKAFNENIVISEITYLVMIADELLEFEEKMLKEI